MATNEKKDAIADMPTNYKPSLSTGVYGTYTINSNNFNPKKYTYLPSVSSGIFGTWLYNDSSPYKTDAITITKTSTCTKTKIEKSMEPSSGYSSWFRKSEPIDYKFEIQGPRKEAIQNGKKYNVKLLQEYKLPLGQKLANMIKSKQQNTQNTQQTTATGTGTGTLFICEGSVVSFTGECIINAANEGMLGGGGVDGAISSAGGDALYHLRQQVPLIKGTRFVRCRVGDAKCTQSGYPYNKLKCDYVIHAVGPNYSILYRGGKNMKMSDIDKLLYASYAKSMLICREKNIKSVGFCLISSGIFRGPRSLDHVLQFGIEAIRDYMFPGIEVFMIGYQNSELVCLSKVAPKILGKMHKEYAKVKERKGWGGWGGWNRSRGGNQDDDDKDDDDDDTGFFNFGWSSKKKRNMKSNKGKAKGNTKSGGGKIGQKKKNDS